MELMQPWTVLLPTAEVSVDVSEDLQHVNNIFVTIFSGFATIA
jgi:hypothetical protein